MSAVINDQGLLAMQAPPTEWVKTHAPAANNKATCVKAAPGAGLQHVVTSVTARLAAGASAPTAINVSVSLIEDAAGTPATIATWTMSIPAVAGENCPPVEWRGNLEIAANKSITLEFSAAGGANTIESVVLTGYTKNTATATPAN